MKVQKNQKTNQLFLNLPKQLCRSMQIFKGTEIKLQVKGEKEIELIIEGVKQDAKKAISGTVKRTEADISKSETAVETSKET